MRNKVAGRNPTRIICAVFLIVFFATGTAVYAQGESQGAIHIDIPVKLHKADVVFDIGHPSFAGDMPLAMHFMGLLAKRVKKEGVKGHIIGVFYGSATYMVLNDEAYNASRKVSTGNPYRHLIAQLLKENVQLEVCAVALKAYHWTNSDLLAGVKVNAGAIGRIVQLVQDGYVRMQP
jgi:intracellular sulfur oxidation DsrE/DsrF family protein